MLLGAETDTLDNEGKIVKSKSIPKFNDATISFEILKSFLGTYYQICLQCFQQRKLMASDYISLLEKILKSIENFKIVRFFEMKLI